MLNLPCSKIVMSSTDLTSFRGFEKECQRLPVQKKPLQIFFAFPIFILDVLSSLMFWSLMALRTSYTQIDNVFRSTKRL